jgi:hypothetical protein
MMRRPVRFGSFALLLRVALAQTLPDVAQILKKVSETYKAASQYELVGDVTSMTSALAKTGPPTYAWSSRHRTGTE